MKKELAEFFGTFALVFFGCGAVAVAGASALGHVGIALAFGLALMTALYVFGGGHYNPAVSFAHFVAGKMNLNDFIRFAVAQLLGALAGTYVLLFLLGHHTGGYDLSSHSIGQTMWGDYGRDGAFLFEVLATYVFVKVIFKTSNCTSGVCGLVIGLTLAGMHFMGLDISGTSLNPARSFGPAFFVGGKAMDQVWLYFVAPLIGGGLAGFCTKQGYFCCGGSCGTSKK